MAIIDSTPTIEQTATAQELGLHIVNVIVLGPKGEDDIDNCDFQAFAMAPTQPRAGETIFLRDGTECVVKRVMYKTSDMPDEELPLMIPNILAEFKERI